MNRKMLLLLYLILSTSSAWAKDKVDRLPPYEDTYWIEHFTSIADAVEKAKDMAISAALEEKYGRVFDTKNYTEVKSVGGVQSTNFYNSGSSQIKGKLVRIVSCETKPEIDDKMIKVRVRVEITAKARNENIHASWQLLNRMPGTKPVTDWTDTEKFVNNDPFFLRFRSTEEGYLAVYLQDENMQVYNLLPYGKVSSAVHVNSKQDYLFFCDDRRFFASHKEYVKPDNFKLVQPLRLTSPDEEVENRVYILFSPEKFTCKTTGDMDNLSVLSKSDFDDWLFKMREEKDDFWDECRDIRIAPRR